MAISENKKPASSRPLNNTLSSGNSFDDSDDEPVAAAGVRTGAGSASGSGACGGTFGHGEQKGFQSPMSKIAEGAAQMNSNSGPSSITP